MKILEPHKHIWPWFEKELNTDVDTALSKSQSAKTILGFFPPNSKLSFLNMGAAMAAILLPVSVPPVNEIALIFGFCTYLAILVVKTIFMCRFRSN